METFLCSCCSAIKITLTENCTKRNNSDESKNGTLARKTKLLWKKH